MIDDYRYVWNGDQPWKRREILMRNKNVTLPVDDVPVGSIAYTADGSYVAMFDGENWVEWGGDSNE